MIRLPVFSLATTDLSYHLIPNSTRSKTIFPQNVSQQNSEFGISGSAISEKK